MEDAPTARAADNFEWLAREYTGRAKFSTGAERVKLVRWAAECQEAAALCRSEEPRPVPSDKPTYRSI